MKLESKNKNLAVLLMILICCSLLAACSKTDKTSVEANAGPTVADIASPAPASTEPSAEPSATSAPSAESAKKGPLTIKYVGNSCFYLTFPDGTTILTDPFPAQFTTYFGPAPDMKVDAYTVSHYHEDHVPGLKQLKGDPKKITSALMDKPIQVGGVEITGFPSKHVASLGDNEIYVFQFGDLKIVHMGETDRIESPDALKAVKDADVMLTYAGEYGPSTFHDADIFKTLYGMNIKVLIPQHFSNNPEAIFYGEPTITQILKEVPQGIQTSTLDELVVTKDMKKQFVALSQMNAK